MFTHIAGKTAALVLLVVTTGSIYADDKKSGLPREQSMELQQAMAETKLLSRQVEAIQRDQLNYKIEKDLLKETYASNLQGINIVITIVFGVFGVVGYLGVRSIKEIKIDYGSELEKLRGIKSSFEAELEILRKQQQEFESKVADLAKVNDSQDRRLKVMELIEKVGSLIRLKNFTWALEHISVGLSIDQENILLLTQKTLCLGKLGHLDEAISTCKLLLKLEPNNHSHVSNLLELLSLTGNSDEFEDYYSKFKPKVDNLFSGGLIAYFRSILAIMQEDYGRAKTAIDNYAANQPPEAKARLDNWSFDDALTVTNSLPDGTKKRALLTTIKYFKGESTQSEMQTAFQADEP